MASEKALLRRVRKFIPPGVSIVAVDMATANPIDAQRRSTPVVLTDRGLSLVTATGLTGVVTDIPFGRVTDARAEGAVLVVSFLDEGHRPRTVEADFGRGGAQIIEQFLRELQVIQPALGGKADQVPVARYHVAWDHGKGATLEVFESERRRFIRPAYDHDVAGLEAAELCKQATMELERALADNPELVWVRDKAEWMPEFVWDPRCRSRADRAIAIRPTA